ncbi:MAG TPA: acyl carrier protein [Thermomicrobiales bacterium]|nr:acyl carrier protein [Thermomicrobiales bacterium]
MANMDPVVLAEVLDLIHQMADDWEYSGDVTEDTFFLSDMGLESLDLVILGTMIQQRYGQLPFAEFLAEIGQRPVEERDVTVGELVSYICQHRRPIAARGA